MTTLRRAIANPVIVIFLASNVVNAGNLAFNVLFSRWMGPELFGALATVLTVKLAALGVLGALQIAVSHRVAQASGAASGALDAALARLNRALFAVATVGLPLVLAAVWFGGAGQALGLGSGVPLVVLLLALPVAVPLSILRGVAYGRLDVRAVLASTGLEMVVRLVGASLAWQAGLGLPGVVAALAVSIVAGWGPLVRLLPATEETTVWQDTGRALALAAVPFAVLQASQVVLLDGDVILARRLLGAGDAGLVAALSLFQRVQFFACFGLAAVLLPSVGRALADGRSARGPVAAVIALFGAASALTMAGAVLAPGAVVDAFVGSSFQAAAPVLWIAAASAIAFTASYLSATYLSASGDHAGIWILAAACPAQLWAMSVWAGGLQEMLSAKLAVQLGLAAILLVRVAWRAPRAAAPVPA